MNQRDLDSYKWDVERGIRAILRYGDHVVDSVRLCDEMIDRFGDDPDPANIEDFFNLGTALADVWLDHPQGQALRGDLTPSTLTDVLDRNVLLSETSNNKE
jgi:hypothetical protein